MFIHTDQSRRAFLHRMSQAALAGSASALTGSLSLIGEAAAATASDYKALVCVFLVGGNDHANTLPPYDAPNYALYRTPRDEIAIERELLAATVLQPDNDLGGRQFALNPALMPLLPVFNQGSLAVLLNVGTLIRPLVKSQYNLWSKNVPPRLFSHRDQQEFFRTCNVNDPTTGWAGRIGDLLQSSNSNKAMTCISTNGRTVFLFGSQTVPYSIGTAGANELLAGDEALYKSEALYDSLVRVMTEAGGGMFSRDHASAASRAINLSARFNSALDGMPASSFPLFPAENDLASRLQAVARTIAVSSELGTNRQVFYVTMGGFDTHNGIPDKHPVLLAALANALKAFFDTTVQLGVSDKVTTFTASDFGRTLSSNGDGSDHGWGGTHFIMGGAVKGRRTYGTPPAIGIGTNDDVGGGRLLPTTSVDQYAATLASWFGVAANDLPLVLPNLVNFDPSTWNIGFV
ncbi:DUF1501 domain-containing protein [Novosphingobium lindaniclasticum]